MKALTVLFALVLAARSAAPDAGCCGACAGDAVGVNAAGCDRAARTERGRSNGDECPHAGARSCAHGGDHRRCAKSDARAHGDAARCDMCESSGCAVWFAPHGRLAPRALLREFVPGEGVVGANTIAAGHPALTERFTRAQSPPAAIAARSAHTLRSIPLRL